MRTAADACDPAGFQPGDDIYLGYVDGRCATDLGAIAARFPGAAVAGISSVASDAGTIGDVEPGNPGWPTWIRWVGWRRAADADPTLYCMDDGKGGSVWDGWRHQDGVRAFAAAGVSEPHWWVAHPDGDPSCPPYAVAAQCRYVGPYDVSNVPGPWPGVDGGSDMTPEQAAQLAAIYEQLTQSAAAGQIPTRGQQLEMLFGLLTDDGNPAKLGQPFVDALAAAVVAKLPAAGATLTADDVAAAVTARLKGELS